MKKLKEIISSFAIGVTIGMFSTIFFSSAYNTFSFSKSIFCTERLSTQNALISIIIYGIIGIISYFSAKIFDKVENLMTATILHFVTICSTVSLAGYILNWPIGLNFYVTFTVIYIIIYFIIYMYTYQNIKKINEKI